MFLVVLSGCPKPGGGGGGPTKPRRCDVDLKAVIGHGGVIVTFVEGENLQGILSWFDPAAEVLRVNDEVKVLENFLAPTDFTLGDTPVGARAGSVFLSAS